MELGHDFRHHIAVAVVPRAGEPGRKGDDDSRQRRVLKLERVAMLRQDLQPGRQMHRLIGRLGEGGVRCRDPDRPERQKNNDRRAPHER
jgi:hypothetical protein